MPPQGAKTTYKPKNKDIRRDIYLKNKRSKESDKRDERFKRKREEDKKPQLREARLAKNIPQTLERKRVWDEVDADIEGDGIGLSVDIGGLSKRLKAESDSNRDGLTEEKVRQIPSGGSRVPLKIVADKEVDEDDEDDEEEDDSNDEEDEEEENSDREASAAEDDDLASLLSSEDEDGEKEDSKDKRKKRGSSPQMSTTSTAFTLIPDALAAKFPTLFTPSETPSKILITTNLNGTVHAQANLLTSLFPNSVYIPRTRHRYNSHHFSLREIAKFASNRSYSALLVLAEDRKRPSGLTVIHLPAGPTFHFSISNWTSGSHLPGHGNPTNHHPELILNNFRTPLGLLTAHLFRSMFPPAPELEGRQVVTLHNQRDYIFVRRHRYVFRDKRASEKSVTDANTGKAVQGVEDIKAGLQELGPRFTLKLRRVDKGIQRASGQEWEWKAGMEKVRTRFNL